MTHCDECVMKPYCVARISDSTVTGCNIFLLHQGLISEEEFAVERTDRGDNMNKTSVIENCEKLRKSWINVNKILCKCPYCGAVQYRSYKCKECKKEVTE